ncbi:MAG: tripartite tricarboxylate transporter substrate binding protein [Burkholderiaceae bacterium]|nr:tripartite tricarboxylate transporter substrate binding protein [Burkholderiaceae bacterium]
MINRRNLLQAVGSSLVLTSLSSWSQSYPSRPIRMIIPFPPGGPTDVLGRIVAQKLSERLGQSVVVDNKPGASGMIGADIVAKAAPDGYTLLVNASLHVINPSLYEKPRYDAIADFTPLSNLADVPLVLVVNSKAPVQTVKELIAWIKLSKTPVNFASSGNATAPHLAGEAFKVAANIENMQHVPYKGSAPALTDLLGGQVQLMFDSLPSSQPFIKSGTLKAIAVTTQRRSSALPNIPTISESAIPGFNFSTWYGMWAPASTPAAIVEKLSSEIGQITRLPDVREKFLSLGAEPVGSTSDDFSAFNKSELKKWARIVKQSGARVD